MKVVFKATQIDLLNVLKIDKQQFMTQFDLAAKIKMPNRVYTDTGIRIADDIDDAANTVLSA